MIKLVIQFVRSLAFNLFFYGNTALAAVTVTLVSYIAPKRVGVAVIRLWCRTTVIGLRILGGAKSEFRGQENVPEGGCIIAAKHQSNWDVPGLFPHVGNAAFIMKKQLMDLPFVGRTAQQVEPIPIDRANGRKALKMMMECAAIEIGRGRNVFIFVEGTRREPGAEANYKYGIAKLYKELNVPVVPVALNSGLFMGRRKFRIWPGTIVAEFLPTIEPGLEPDIFFEKLQETIETASDGLLREAVEADSKRVFSPQILKKISVTKQ